ncbi:MAG: hypothetical protein HY700_10825 [Gemmatimonadetes bacterium]|nr:hypothetical protein [Gemmatimonadota bacterium]
MPTEAEVLQGIGLCVEDQPNGKNRKLASVEPGSVDAFYMVAAYCFDLTRKIHYIYKAARPLFDQRTTAIAPEVRTLAQEIIRDRDRIRSAGRNWKAMAEILEEIILAQYDEIGADHDRLLERTATSESSR